MARARRSEPVLEEHGAVPARTLPARRPAESGAVAAAVALLVARLLGVDDVDVVAALAVVIGFLPAAITYVVEQVERAR